MTKMTDDTTFEARQQRETMDTSTSFSTSSIAVGQCSMDEVAVIETDGAEGRAGRRRLRKRRSRVRYSRSQLWTRPSPALRKARRRTHSEAGPSSGEALPDVVAGRERKRLRVRAGVTELHTAARDGDLATMRRLLERGADADARDAAGATPLHWAVGFMQEEAVALLIAHGADVDAQLKGGNESSGRRLRTA